MCPILMMGKMFKYTAPMYIFNDENPILEVPKQMLGISFLNFVLY